MGNLYDNNATSSAFLRYLTTLATKRKVFISYYHGDKLWAQTFIDSFGTGTSRVFIPKALGLNYENDEIRSNNPTYVIGQIRERRIIDSSVQIVLVGQCTHSRRYIDWEIKRSLSNGNGLIGILIPPHTRAHLPERFQANWSADGGCYARFYYYPQSENDLRDWIDDAYQARTTRSSMIKNAQDVWGYNRVCNVCGYNHN